MRLNILRQLISKNIIIAHNHRFKYIFIYASPCLILIILLLLQSWTQSNLKWQNYSPQQFKLPPLPRCFGSNCITIGIVYNGPKQPYMKTVIKELQQKNGLNEGDIQQIPIDFASINQYLELKPNKTQSIVVFCSNQSFKVGQIEIPCYADHYHLNFYSIIYNLSLFHRIPYMGNLKQSYPKDFVTIKLKYDIDQAIIKHYHPQATLHFQFADFPSQTSRFIKGVSIISQYGSFFLMLPYLALLVMEGGRLLLQKEKRLRIGLNIVGVSHLQFYLSQILTYMGHVTIITIIFCAFGYGFGFKFWRNGIISFNAYIMMMNGFVLGLLKLCIVAVVKERGLGMSILYGFVLYSVIMQWLFTGGFLFDMLYFKNVSLTILLLRYLFNLYPSFHFSKLFSDITRKADNHMDTYENRFIEGTQFTWQDIFIAQTKSYQKPFPQTYILPSPFQSAVYLFLTSIIFALLLCLFDKFIQSNRGYIQNINFCKKTSRKKSAYFVDDETQCVVKIANLQKKYNQTFALTGVTAQMQKGQIVALLGENGAGKSTLINILIGALGKTKGQVIIDGFDVEKDIESIRKIIGVCPQFDILWEELTAAQHIILFHALKNIPIDNNQILVTLRNVGLHQNIHGRVNTFSGGMRRRLSLALSLVGSPKFVILDEPTTGMDARMRLLTWKLILGLGKKHTVLITTHNMEEAECVSDRIMIMAKGRVIAEGSAVQLKKQFGGGYVIKGHNGQKEMVWRCKQEQLQEKLIEIQEGKISNWSLHEATLQEVFLNVSTRR